MNKRITSIPYVPTNPSVKEVERALQSYYEVTFTTHNGKITAKSRIGTFGTIDFFGADIYVMMPEFSRRPECLSCFYIDINSNGLCEGNLFYQTKEYIKIYNDDMSLKKLFLIKDVSA